ncbi:MAG: hypothetical protein VKP62_15560, partial [Candidatus Sericytochromatia bacterium]|nr:hypothetical protein [Candidatus Sericytochromatia bacterium]
RGCGLAFAPGVEHRPLLIPLDTASTMVTCDILFLLDYTPKEIARLEDMVEKLPVGAPKWEAARLRLQELRDARAAFNPLFYAEDLRLAEITLEQADAEDLSQATSLRQAYEVSQKVRKKKKAKGKPKSYVPIEPDSPPELATI